MAFVLSTAYVAISLRQLMEAFIYGPPGTAIAYFADVGRMLPQAKIGLYTVNVRAFPYRSDARSAHSEDASGVSPGSCAHMAALVRFWPK